MATPSRTSLRLGLNQERDVQRINIQLLELAAMSQHIVNLLRDRQTPLAWDERGYDRIANFFSRQRQTESMKVLYAELLSQER
jgi:hypothetical protein